MSYYISRDAAKKQMRNGRHSMKWLLASGSKIIGDAFAIVLDEVPAADVIDEENVLKFYYVRSTDDYWIGQRVGNFYYAEFDPEALRWTWTHSRYLPWGEHVVSQTSLWKEHTYPSKPEEMPFEEWLRGLIKKYFTAADVRPVVLCKDCMYAPSGTDGGEVRGFAIEWPHDEWPEDNPCPCKCEDGWYSHKPKPDFFCANGKREES